MGTEDFDREWRALSEEVLTGMKEGRLQHPKATRREMEAALDERRGRLRAQMLQDTALAGLAADWSQARAEERPVCPQGGTPLVSQGKRSGICKRRGAGGGAGTEVWGLSRLRRGGFPPWMRSWRCCQGV